MSHLSRRALAFGLLAAALPALPARAAEMRVNRNVAYGTDRRQRVDVYLPAARTRPVPFVAFRHGGGWRNGRCISDLDRDRVGGPRLAGPTQRQAAGALSRTHVSLTFPELGRMAATYQTPRQYGRAGRAS